MTCFDRDDDLLSLATIIIMEVESAVDTLIRTFLLLNWSSSN